jgi:fatty acid desaturase
LLTEAEADERDVAQVPASRTVLRRRTGAQPLVAPDLLKHLSRPKAWRAIGGIAMQWGLIALAIAVSVWSDSWWVTIPALFFIATRQHALLIMMHEATHFLISRNRTVNDTVSNLFCAFPFLVSNRRYRINHLLHHRYVNTADDPDLSVNIHPSTRSALLLLLVQDLFCLSLAKTFRRSRKFGVMGIFLASQPGFATERVLFLGFVAALAAVIFYFHIGSQFLLYWVLPLFSFLQVLLTLRGFAEHAGRIDDDLLNHARTVDLGPVERIVFAPCNTNRHLEHHLYPSVPAHNLEALSAALRGNEEFARGTRRTQGYLASRLSVFRELYGRRAPSLPEPANDRFPAETGYRTAVAQNASNKARRETRQPKSMPRTP